MKPVETPHTNWSFHLPGKPGEGVMPCIRDLEAQKTISFWDIEESDDTSAEILCIQIFGFYNTPVRFGTVDSGGRIQIAPPEADPIVLMARSGSKDRQYQLQTSDEFVDWLRQDGNYFVLEVGMCPPMPVSVWFATDD